MKMMEWDAKTTYDEQEFIISIDVDDYLEQFPDMKFIQLKILGKKYKVDRLALSKMIETLEAL